MKEMTVQKHSSREYVVGNVAVSEPDIRKGGKGQKATTNVL
jgi:hypothetical protein